MGEKKVALLKQGMACTVALGLTTSAAVLFGACQQGAEESGAQTEQIFEQARRFDPTPEEQKKFVKLGIG